MSAPFGQEPRSEILGYAIDTRHPTDQGFWACVLDVTEPELMHALTLISPELHPVQRYLNWRPFLSSTTH